jgi:hypothetical protein
MRSVLPRPLVAFLQMIGDVARDNSSPAQHENEQRAQQRPEKCVQANALSDVIRAPERSDFDYYRPDRSEDSECRDDERDDPQERRVESHDY